MMGLRAARTIPLHAAVTVGRDGVIREITIT